MQNAEMLVIFWESHSFWGWDFFFAFLFFPIDKCFHAMYNTFKAVT